MFSPLLPVFVHTKTFACILADKTRRPRIRVLTAEATRGQLPELTTEHAVHDIILHARGRLALHAGVLAVGRPAVRRGAPHTAPHRGARLGCQVLRLAAQPARDVRAALGWLSCFE